MTFRVEDEEMESARNVLRLVNGFDTKKRIRLICLRIGKQTNEQLCALKRTHSRLIRRLYNDTVETHLLLTNAMRNKKMRKQRLLIYNHMIQAGRVTRRADALL